VPCCWLSELEVAIDLACVGFTLIAAWICQILGSRLSGACVQCRVLLYQCVLFWFCLPVPIYIYCGVPCGQFVVLAGIVCSLYQLLDACGVM
jgi:hypothetical protein